MGILKIAEKKLLIASSLVLIMSPAVGMHGRGNRGPGGPPHGPPHHGPHHGGPPHGPPHPGPHQGGPPHGPPPSGFGPPGGPHPGGPHHGHRQGWSPPGQHPGGHFGRGPPHHHKGIGGPGSPSAGNDPKTILDENGTPLLRSLLTPDRISALEHFHNSARKGPPAHRAPPTPGAGPPHCGSQPGSKEGTHDFPNSDHENRRGPERLPHRPPGTLLRGALERKVKQVLDENSSNGRFLWVKESRFQDCPRLLLEMVLDAILRERPGIRGDILDDYGWVSSADLSEENVNYLVCCASIRRMVSNPELLLEEALPAAKTDVTCLVNGRNLEDRISDARLFLEMIKARELCRTEQDTG